MIIQCLIVGADDSSVGILKSYIEKTPCLSLWGICNSDEEMEPALNSNEFLLVFLDVDSFVEKGCHVPYIADGRCEIICISQTKQYAYEAIKLHALDYLLKPLSFDDFLVSTSAVLKTKNTASANEIPRKTLWVKTAYKLVQIEIERILYIEGMVDYVKFVLDDDPKPILSLMSLKKIEEVLPGQMFVRTHRSFIVQLSKIGIIERNKIIFGKQEIPISDSYRNRLFDLIESTSYITY